MAAVALVLLAVLVAIRPLAAAEDLSGHGDMASEWRASIPDYDKRLYDRVSQISSRVVSLQRLAVASIILNIGTLGVLIAYMTRRRSPSSGGDDVATTPRGSRWATVGTLNWRLFGTGTVVVLGLASAATTGFNVFGRGDGSFHPFQVAGEDGRLRQATAGELLARVIGIDWKNAGKATAEHELLKSLRPAPLTDGLLLLNPATPDETWTVAGLTGRTVITDWPFHADQSLYDVAWFTRTFGPAFLKRHNIRYILLEAEHPGDGYLRSTEESSDLVNRARSSLLHAEFVEGVKTVGRYELYTIRRELPPTSGAVVYVGGNQFGLSAADIPLNAEVLTAIDPAARARPEFRSPTRVVFNQSDIVDYAAWLTADSGAIPLASLVDVKAQQLRTKDRFTVFRAFYWPLYHYWGRQHWAFEFNQPLGFLFPGYSSREVLTVPDDGIARRLLVYGHTDQPGCAGRLSLTDSQGQNLVNLDIPFSGGSLRWRASDPITAGGKLILDMQGPVCGNPSAAVAIGRMSLVEDAEFKSARDHLAHTFQTAEVVVR